MRYSTIYIDKINSDKMNKKEVILNTLEDTKKLAEEIAQNCKKGDVILLNGTLGTGKTTFAQYFISGLLSENRQQEISSPTFNLLKTYDTEKFPVHHLDLYRLKDYEELYELGIEDILYDGICLIEWPELVMDFLDDGYMLINLEISDGVRRAVVEKY